MYFVIASPKGVVPPLAGLRCPTKDVTPRNDKALMIRIFQRPLRNWEKLSLEISHPTK